MQPPNRPGANPCRPADNRVVLALLATLALPAIAHKSACAQEASPRGPAGMWLTEGGNGVIRIAPCGERLCGALVGLSRAPNDPIPTDAAGRSQCGLTILTARTDPRDHIAKGWITDPRDGTTYHAELWVDATGRLNMRGYVGIPLFGATHLWEPFAGRIAADCRFT